MMTEEDRKKVLSEYMGRYENFGLKEKEVEEYMEQLRAHSEENQLLFPDLHVEYLKVNGKEVPFALPDDISVDLCPEALQVAGTTPITMNPDDVCILDTKPEGVTELTKDLSIKRMRHAIRNAHWDFRKLPATYGKIIIAIVGESGAGKTTFAKYLAYTRHFEDIISYTTRPMREGEMDGVDHMFVDEDRIPPKDMMLAHTKYGGYDYWVEKAQIFTDAIQIYVIDEKGLLELEEEWGDVINIFSIYIKRPNNPIDAARKNRDKHRVTIEEGYYNLILDNHYQSAAEFCIMASLEFDVAFDRFLLHILDKKNGKNEKN